MSDITDAPFPQFEFVGPPCEQEGCKGVLMDCISRKRGVFFRKCVVCKTEHHIVSLAEKNAEVIRIFERVFDLADEDDPN